MTTTVSIAELQHAGVTLEPVEAVAVAQQLIQTLRRSDDAGEVEPPYGPPTAANVVLNADGSVSCAACGTTPAISEIAIFLDALLPPGSLRVPGGLRYTIARGLLEVDVAPFDSLDDFSRALGRHESGPRDEVVRRLLRRAEWARAAAAGARADRRRARTTELRRALREADAQLYAHQLAAAVPPSRRSRFSPPSREALWRDHAEAIAEAGEPRRSWRSIWRASGGGPIPPPPTRTRNVPAIAVCLGSGLMLISAGEFMYRWPTTEPVVAPVVAPVTLATAGTRPAVTTVAPAFPLSEHATGARADEATVRERALQPYRECGLTPHPERARRQPALRIPVSPSASCPRPQPLRPDRSDIGQASGAPIRGGGQKSALASDVARHPRPPAASLAAAGVLDPRPGSLRGWHRRSAESICNLNSAILQCMSASLNHSCNLQCSAPRTI